MGLIVCVICTTHLRNSADDAGFRSGYRDYLSIAALVLRLLQVTWKFTRMCLLEPGNHFKFMCWAEVFRGETETTKRVLPIFGWS